jgi:hypothetical protein
MGPDSSRPIGVKFHREPQAARMATARDIDSRKEGGLTKRNQKRKILRIGILLKKGYSSDAA